MLTNEKEQILLANGWEIYTNAPTYVKTEWFTEPERLNLEPCHCPHWYQHRTLNEAYKEFLFDFGLVKPPPNKSALVTFPVNKPVELTPVKHLPFNVVVHDTECYPNVWTYGDINPVTGERHLFEISPRINQINEFRAYVRHMAFHKTSMVGFNSIGYDYPVIHAIMTDLKILDHTDIFKVSKAIIDTDWNDRFKNRIPEYRWIKGLKQIDLFMIHHFDNAAKSTSLKMLEFVMKLKNISDLPFKPETTLTFDQIQTLIDYQDDDIDATNNFFLESIGALEFRHTLSIKYDKNFMNHNDTKIGKDYFIMELEKAGIPTKINGVLQQTWRSYIDLNDCIPAYVKFEHPEFNRVLNEIRNTRITETKGALQLSAVINGFSYDFGLGGIHGAVKGRTFRKGNGFKIKDLDVASYYPNLAIKNGLYPEHLSDKFCEIYEDLYNQRRDIKKQMKLLDRNSDEYKSLDGIQAVLKLALNGTYGDSNSVYSPFYDSKFTMSITISGQLLLCMLAEQLIKIPQLEVISINTDGVCIYYPEQYENQVLSIWKWWEQLTQLELEDADYDMYASRDVNNYISTYSGSDKVKYNGAYAYDSLGWHQNHNCKVVTMAACEAILHGKNVREFIMNHDDIFDFFLCTKVNRKDNLVLQEPVYWGDKMVLPAVTTEILQNITRYYVSNSGSKLVKLMSPLKRKKGVNIEMTLINWQRGCGLNKNLKVKTEYEYNSAITLGYRIKKGGSFTHSAIRESGVDKDWLVTPMNNIEPNQTYDINYQYYITEAEKLVNKVL